MAVEGANMKKATERDLQLLEMAPLASYLPLTYRNGACWESLKCECQGCDKPLDDNLVRGIVVKHGDHMVAVEASGVCHECRLITRFVFRLYDDMRLSALTKNGWETWGRKRESFWERMIRQVNLVFKR